MCQVMGELAGNYGSSRPAVVRMPLAPVAAVLACGIAAGRFAPLPVGVWVVLGAGGLLAAVGTLALRARAWGMRKP